MNSNAHGLTDRHSSKRLLIAGILLAAALTLNWLSPADEAAQVYLDDAITGNLVIYASARSINGIISVIQSLELSFSLGAGIALNPGQVLDPLNDLIERFSAFILYALAGLGLQQLVLIGSSSLFAKTLTTAALLAGFAAWFINHRFWQVLRQLMIVILLVRFALLLEVGLIWSLDQMYFNQQQAAAYEDLSIAQEKLSSIHETYLQEMKNSGPFAGFQNNSQNLIGVQEQESITDLAAPSIVQLIVIMLVRSILLPSLFLLLVIVAIKHSGRPPPNNSLGSD